MKQPVVCSPLSVVSFCFALSFVGAMLFALCVPGLAQQPKKIYRIGYLSALSPSSESNRSEVIRLGLSDLGYMEGQNVVIEYRYSHGEPGRARELAAELVRLNVDIIVVAGGDLWIRAAKDATQTIPVVMLGGGLDPVEAGHVKSLARPGGNVTGLTILNTELTAKRLGLFKEAVPKLTRVAVLHNPTIPSNVRELKDVQTAARALGLTVQPWMVRDPGGFDAVFAAMSKERQDGLYVCQGGILNDNRKLIVDFALKSRLPSVYSNKESVMPVGSCTTGRTARTATGVSHTTWTRS